MLAIRWAYEPRGFMFHLADEYNPVHYRPDFYLIDSECFAEIKPTAPSKDEVRKVILLSEKNPVFFLIGHPTNDMGQIWKYEDGKHVDDEHSFTHCDTCGQSGITLQGSLNELLPCNCGKDATGGWTSLKIQDAIRAARAIQDNWKKPQEGK